MNGLLSESLKKIVHGVVIAMVGMFLGIVLQFITRLLIARYGLEVNYGIFSLALAVLTFGMMLASMGLHQGATRYIAYARSKNNAVEVRSVISISLLLVVAASVIIGLALFLSAEAVAVNIFHSRDLTTPLQIFAIGMPFFALINIFASLFRGFDRAEPQVYFQYVMLNTLFVIFLLVVTFGGLPFVTVFYAYLAALVITCTASVVYTVKKLPEPIVFRAADVSTSKQLLAFSLPLLGTAMLLTITLWTDTLMLGYFKTPDLVGLYSAAYPLAQFIAFPLSALMLIYIPVATTLFSQDLMAELRKNYVSLTKWLVSLTAPVFLVLCLFPEAVLSIFFGASYTDAALALRILSASFFLVNIFGPGTATLIALGKPRFVMWVTLAGATVNVVLNIILIPPLGIVGAAIASAISFILGSVVVFLRLYSLCQIQPFRWNLFKPLVASVVLAFIFQLVIGNFFTVNWWVLLLLFFLYYLIYGVAIVLTKAFDENDIAMLLEMEKKSGINAAPLRKILKRFL